MQNASNNIESGPSVVGALPDMDGTEKRLNISTSSVETISKDLQVVEAVSPPCEETKVGVCDSPSQVFSLDRGGYSSTIIVTYSGGSSTDGSKGHEDDPFFLVPNRKSGRKVAHH